MSLRLISRAFCSKRSCLNKLSNHKVISACSFIRQYSIIQWDSYDPEKLVAAGTVQEIKSKLAAIMGVEKGYNPLSSSTSRTHLQAFLPSSQNELPPRTMTDSLTSSLIPLSTDAELQDKYVTFLGHVRIGRLLEDMDIFAVYVAQKHLLNPKQPEDKPSPYTLVTALVDQINFTDFHPKPNEDIRLSGHVTWVGKSSIEVLVWLEQRAHGSWCKITEALFLMAARNNSAEKAAFVNPLVATNDNEQKIIDGGEARKKHRILAQSQHLTKVIPNIEEQQIIHDLYLRTVDNEISLKKRNLPAGCLWMDSCLLSNLIFSHPEDRNLHYKVFGGFLMRNATELSWALGYLFSKYRPKLKSISEISFNKPVDVSSLLRMHAHVVFTQMQFFQITVYAETLNSSTGANATTNAFHFTFEVPERVPVIYPLTYHEAMMYIDGRRHFYDVMTKASKPMTVEVKL